MRNIENVCVAFVDLGFLGNIRFRRTPTLRKCILYEHIIISLVWMIRIRRNSAKFER